MTARSGKPAGGEDRDVEGDKRDEALEESFPASDPPASPRTTAGRPDHAKAKAKDGLGSRRKRK